MKHLKKLLPVALVLLLAVLILPGKAEAATVDSGTCGENLTWTLDNAGTLTISGTGPMTDYDWSESPWCSNASVKKIVIGDGITTISKHAFYSCFNLTSVTIPDSVTSIGDYAFQYCDSLTDVYYYGTEAAWKKISIGADNYALLDATIHFVMPGDMDSDRKLTTDDAVYLLLHVMFGAEDYPLPAGVSLDLDGDGTTTTNDSVYLLLHVMFGAEDYPLYPDNDPVMTYQEFLAAEDDSTVCIETYVQATESWWENTITAYAQSKDGAYYLYMMDCSEEDAAKLVPGTKIRVTGIKAHWAGLPEIMYGTFEFVEATPYIAEPIDATAMTEAELKANINKLATFKGLTVEKIEYKGGEPGDDIYLTLKNGNVSMAFHVEIYLTGEDTDVYKTVGTLAVGDTVDVTGFLHWYEGPYPYIIDIAKVTT